MIAESHVNEGTRIGDVAFLHHFVTEALALLDGGVETVDLESQVLLPFAEGLQEVPVDRRRVVALLDQLELHVPVVPQCDGHLEIGRFSLVGEGLQRHPLAVEPGADAHHLGPVTHRGLDVPDDVGGLNDLSEDVTHGVGLYWLT